MNIYIYIGGVVLRVVVCGGVLVVCRVVCCGVLVVCLCVTCFSSYTHTHTGIPQVLVGEDFLSLLAEHKREVRLALPLLRMAEQLLESRVLEPLINPHGDEKPAKGQVVYIYLYVYIYIYMCVCVFNNYICNDFFNLYVFMYSFISEQLLESRVLEPLINPHGDEKPAEGRVVYIYFYICNYYICNCFVICVYSFLTEQLPESRVLEPL